LVFLKLEIIAQGLYWIAKGFIKISRKIKSLPNYGGLNVLIRNLDSWFFPVLFFQGHCAFYQYGYFIIYHLYKSALNYRVGK